MLPILLRARQLHLGLCLTFRAAIFLSHVALTFALEWIPANFFAAAGRQSSVAGAGWTPHTCPLLSSQGTWWGMDIAPSLTSALTWTQDLAPFPAHSSCCGVKGFLVNSGLTSFPTHFPSPIGYLLVELSLGYIQPTLSAGALGEPLWVLGPNLPLPEFNLINSWVSFIVVVSFTGFYYDLCYFLSSTFSF